MEGGMMKLDKRAFYLELGMRIALIRKVKRITQATLAKSCGLTRTSIVNIEQGRQGVDCYNLILISRALTLKQPSMLFPRPY
jgi:transcriptional regulator with XRE-family HTH domain